MNRKRHRESASPTDSMVFNDDRYNDADDDQPMNESKPIGDSNDCTEAETCLQETNIEPHMVIFDVAEDCSNGMDTTMEEEATTPSNTAIVEDTITTANKTSKDDTEKEATICVDETMDEEEATTPANSTMDEDETITLASTLMEVEATTPVNNTTAKESSTPSKKTNKGDGVDEDIRAFFTSPVVSSSDVALVGPSVTRSLEEVVVLMETKGPKLYTEYKANKTKNQYRSASKKKGENDDGTKNDKPTEEDYDPSCLEGTDPRSYQMALLNIAKKQNTIVHLGTGTG